MTLRRIVVALDASGPTRELARAAAELARALGAELTGLFVEDEALLRLAALPFAREVAMLGGLERPLTRGSLEADLRALAARAREALAEAANTSRVSFTFRVSRGSVTEEVLAAASEADLLVLGASSHRSRAGPGATARAAAERSPAAVLLHPRHAGAGRPVAAAADGSPEGERAIRTAAALAAAEGRPLVIRSLARGPDQGEQIAARAAAIAEGRGRAAWAGGAGLEHLLGALRAEPPVRLVLPASSPLLAGDGLRRLLADAGCAVVLVR